MTAYLGFEIEAYEIGRGQWHARFRRIDRKPMFVDGSPLERVELGFAWPAPEPALANARDCIDRMIARNELRDVAVADVEQRYERPPVILSNRALERKFG